LIVLGLGFSRGILRARAMAHPSRTPEPTAKSLTSSSMEIRARLPQGPAAILARRDAWFALGLMASSAAAVLACGLRRLSRPTRQQLLPTMADPWAGVAAQTPVHSEAASRARESPGLGRRRRQRRVRRCHVDRFYLTLIRDL
jgi:hypothetical protein